MHSFLKQTFLSLTVLSLGLISAQAGHPSRGLWVGEVALNAVNEATGAVGDSNSYVFTDPEVVTPTSDTAYLRLIVHVNGAGQAQLLKSVAVVAGGSDASGAADIVLLTDPTLYSSYPGIAKRYASAFYEFGSAESVTAVDQLIETATALAVSQAGSPEATIQAYVQAGLDPIVAGADVESAYLSTEAASFITTGFFDESEAIAIGNEVASLMDASTHTVESFAYDPEVAYAPFTGASSVFGFFTNTMLAATNLRTASQFYDDTRGIEAIAEVVVAAAIAVGDVPTVDLVTKQANAVTAAVSAWHNAADVNQDYNRFLASSDFTRLPDFIVDVVVQTAIVEAGVTSDPAIIIAAIKDALTLETPVSTVDAASVFLESASLFGDPRAINVFAGLIDSTAEAAATQVLVDATEVTLKEVVVAAANNAFESIEAAPVFARAPTTAYSDFVVSDEYEAAATTAASVAAAEVAFQYGVGVRRPEDLAKFAKEKVSIALVGIRNQVAALPQNTVPLAGSLAPGGSVAGEFILPALAPTNPFLHRLHPDHTVGIEITRQIELTINAAEDVSGLDRSGYGVSRLTGTYLEEIFGLHKALGNSQDVGLKTQGTFTLNRLTLVDSLNF